MPARFLSRVENPTSEYVEVDGVFFEYQSFDHETEAALLSAASLHYVLWKQEESIRDDGWGDHTNIREFSFPLTEMNSLTEVFNFQSVSGDILVENGALAGIVVFTATDWNSDKEDRFIPIKAEKPKYKILYIDEDPHKSAYLSYSGSAGRVWCDISGAVSYTLTDKLIPYSSRVEY